MPDTHTDTRTHAEDTEDEVKKELIIDRDYLYATIDRWLRQSLTSWILSSILHMVLNGQSSDTVIIIISLFWIWIEDNETSDWKLARAYGN